MKRSTLIISCLFALNAGSAWGNELEDIGMQVTDDPNANVEKAYRELSLPSKASATGVENSASGLERANEVRSNRDAQNQAQEGLQNALDNAAEQASEGLQRAQDAQENGNRRGNRP